MNVARIVDGLDSGSLRSRIIFQKQSDAQDAGGGHDSRWQDFYSCWSYIIGWSQNERFQNDQFISENTHLIVIRYCPNIKTNMNISYRDGDTTRNFRVKNVSNYEERKIWTVIEAQELTPVEATT